MHQFIGISPKVNHKQIGEVYGDEVSCQTPMHQFIGISPKVNHKQIGEVYKMSLKIPKG
jgi:hypothetical protein